MIKNLSTLSILCNSALAFKAKLNVNKVQNSPSQHPTVGAPVSIDSSMFGTTLSMTTYWGSNAQEIQTSLDFSNGAGGMMGDPDPIFVKSSECTTETCGEYAPEATQSYDCGASSSCVQTQPGDYT